jgi:hypothetical protein
VPANESVLGTRARVQSAGRVEIRGRAWSGEAGIALVEFAVDGDWREGALRPVASPYAWQSWHALWDATRGEHELACRATDAAGNVQPLAQPWNYQGMGNNLVQRVTVTAR